MSASQEIARDARALKRDNAQDAVARAIHTAVPGLPHDGVRPMAQAVVAELATWFRERAAPTLTNDPFIRAADWAADLLQEFQP